MRIGAEEIYHTDHPETQKTLDWYQDARFGMMVCLGVYSMYGEAAWWYVRKPKRARFGNDKEKLAAWEKEYKETARSFNPVNFDAEALVLLAKNTGMKWITITAKHHDGFCIYPSNYGGFSTTENAFDRDIFAELKAACDKHGIKLSFYYSQFQDWTYPGGGFKQTTLDTQEDIEAFEKYVEEKSIPQVKELVERYDPCIIWYDTPFTSHLRHSQEFRKVVKDISPQTLVCDRIGNLQGDYMSFPDNMVSDLPVMLPWETCMISTSGWGYKPSAEHPQGGKQADQLIMHLCEIVSRGGNFLLNLGPRGDGGIPAYYPVVYGEIGKWMSVHSEAIHGTKGNPFLDQPEKLCAVKGNKLYYYFPTYTGGEGVEYEITGEVIEGSGENNDNTQNKDATVIIPDTLSIQGLKNPVLKAYFMDDPSKTYNVEKSQDGYVIHTKGHTPDPYCSVLVVETKGDVETELAGVPVQKPDGTITLFAENMYTSLKEKDVGNIPDLLKGKNLRASHNHNQTYGTFFVKNPGTFQVIIRGLFPNDSEKGFHFRLNGRLYSTGPFKGSEEMQKLVIPEVSVPSQGLQTFVIQDRPYTAQFCGFESVKLSLK
jgi:alpha-L-fucosidase